MQKHVRLAADYLVSFGRRKFRWPVRQPSAAVL